VAEDFVVANDFITQAEHDSLVEEVTSKLKRMKYETTHIDSVITGYREAPISNWINPANRAVVDRVLELFKGEKLQFLPVHALDLQADGHIDPHVDNVKYSGGIIAGLSLLSEAIMRLTQEKDAAAKVEVVIKPRSLYIQRRTCRYEFAHSILGPKEKPLLLAEGLVQRQRRISLMFRDDYTGDP